MATIRAELRRYLWLWWCVGLSIIPLHAEWQVCMSNYTPEDYNAGTQNWQILQDENGWIYVANNYGLLEFDGETWNTYGIRNATVVRSLAHGKNGEIYVGGTDEFGCFTGNRVGQLDYTSFADSVPQEYRHFGEVWSMLLHDSILYVQTRNYIFLRTQQGNIKVIEPKTRIFCMTCVDNNIYVATANGICLLAGNTLNVLQGSELLYNTEVRNMQYLPAKGLLIATDSKGMFLYDGNAIEPFHTEADDFLRKNQLYSFAVDSNRLAFGTVLQGIVLTDINGQNCTYINQHNGLHNSTVLSLLFDKEHNLLAGLDQGLVWIQLDYPTRKLYDANIAYASGYASAINNNYLYLGTNQGLYKAPYNPNTAEIGKVQWVEGASGQVWSLSAIDGTLFCCHHHGLYQLTPKGLKTISAIDGFWKVRKWDDNTLLAGTYRGIYLLQKGRQDWQIVRKIQGFDDTALNFEIDAVGDVWIISPKGVERLRLNRTLDRFTSELVLPYNERHDYIGIARLNKEIFISSADTCFLVDTDGQIQSAAHLCELMDGCRHYALVNKDDNGNIWYITDNKLKVTRYDTAKQAYAISRQLLMQNSNFFIGGFEHLNMLADNKAILGGVQGYYSVDIRELATMTKMSERRLYLRRMSLVGKNDSVLYGESAHSLPHSYNLSYGQYALRFDLGGTACLDQGRTYATRLLPIETDFVTMGTNCSREFSALKDGTYRLEARMYSPLYNQEFTTSFVFRIAPPWYRTTIAYTLYTIIVLMALLLLVWTIMTWHKKGQQRIAKEKDALINEQQIRYANQMQKQQLALLQLQNEKTEYELRNKNRELSNLLLNQINRNELIEEIQYDIRKVADNLKDNDTRQAETKLRNLQAKLSKNKNTEIDWKQFEDNFDMVNDHFLKKLSARYPWMNKNERKLCVYIYMGMLTKEIAPLMNLSVRGVEMMRYRVRQKMGLDAQANLKAFFRLLSEQSTD